MLYGQNGQHGAVDARSTLSVPKARLHRACTGISMSALKGESYFEPKTQHCSCKLILAGQPAGTQCPQPGQGR